MSGVSGVRLHRDNGPRAKLISSKDQTKQPISPTLPLVPDCIGLEYPNLNCVWEDQPIIVICQAQSAQENRTSSSETSNKSSRLLVLYIVHENSIRCLCLHCWTTRCLFLIFSILLSL